MFTSARLKLTAWYLLIIMIVSSLFSLVIWNGIDHEIQRFERLSVIRREDDFFGTRVRRVPAFDPTDIAKTRQRIILTLALINLGIFAFSAFSGFFLAGKTLRPIKEMVDDQDRFVTNASHELRTPLTSMKTETEVALRDKNPTLSQARKLLKSNLEETDKMQSLTANLLSLERHQSLPSQFPLINVNLSGLIIGSINKLEVSSRKKGLTMITKLNQTTVLGNPDSLSELFTILIDNAIKYSRPDNQIIITVKKEGKRAVVSVQDFGIGISKSDLPLIFNRFYRADASRNKSKVDGFGLGLSIAKNIVDLHHGKITVSSTPNSGSTFTVFL